MTSQEIILNTSSTIVMIRWLALIIDNIFITISCLIFPYFLQSHYGETKINSTILILLLLGALFFILLYFTITESLTGYTLGKFVCRIRVVNENGSPPGIIKAFIRALFRILEIYMIGFLGFLIAISSKEKQRLGDKVAKTYVIYSKDIEPEQRKLPAWRYIPCGMIGLVLITIWVSNIINIGYVWSHPSTTQAKEEYAVSPDHLSRLKLPKGWSEDIIFLKKIDADIKAYHITETIFFISHTYSKKIYQNSSLENIRSLINKDLLKNAGPTKNITVNGYPALQFNSVSQDGLDKYHYLFTCVEALQNFYILICWAEESPFEDFTDKMQEVVEGFEEITTPKQ